MQVDAYSTFPPLLVLIPSVANSVKYTTPWYPVSALHFQSINLPRSRRMCTAFNPLNKSTCAKPEQVASYLYLSKHKCQITVLCNHSKKTAQFKS